MKTKFYTITGLIAIAGLSLAPISLKAQQALQYFRPNNQQGVNIFETAKKDTTPFSGMKVKVGGNFEMTYQTLRDQNTATPLTKTGFVGNVNSLIPLTDGFRSAYGQPEP